MAGARLVNFAPVSIAIDGLGLNVTGFSYNGMLWLCAVSCRDMMPDPGFFAECLRENFAALEAGAVRAATHNATPMPASAAATQARKPRAARRRVPSQRVVTTSETA
jgi:hypothetical protein